MFSIIYGSIVIWIDEILFDSFLKFEWYWLYIGVLFIDLELIRLIIFYGMINSIILIYCLIVFIWKVMVLFIKVRIILYSIRKWIIWKYLVFDWYF